VLGQTRRFLRWAPYDTSTEEGRALERYRRASWTTVTNLVAKALAAVMGLVSVPLTVGYLGKEQYGLWMAIGSLLSWAVLADFGMARGLQNHLSEAYGREDEAKAGRLMSTAFFALLGIASVLALLFVPALYLVPWESILRITEPALSAELRPALGAVVAVFLLQFPLSVVGQAYAAYQRGHIANLFSISGSMLSLGVLLLVIREQLGLPWLILASGGVGVGMTLVNLAYLVREMPFLRPRLSLVTGASMAGLVRVSTPMLIFDLGSLLINESQLLLIARINGVAVVADYSIFLKVYAVPIFVVTMLDGPYAPMFREAYSRGDSRWFREAFFKIQRIKVVLTVLGTVFYLTCGNLATGLLSKQAVHFSWQVWGMAGLLLIVGCWNATYNNLFMAIERLWTLVLLILLNGLVTVGLTYFLAGPLGIVGVLIAITTFSLVVTSWLLPFLARDVFRTARPPA
jgi:O-antigen/teichoic acid export membrane protein